MHSTTAATSFSPIQGAKPHAAGNTQLSTVPSGTDTSTGASLPSLQGTSQNSVLVRATPTWAKVLGSVELASLAIWGLLPAKSSLRCSPSLVAVHTIWMGMAVLVCLLRAVL